MSHPPRINTQLTVENVRHHDQLMQDHPKSNADDPKVAKTGILKGGKLWKNGDGKKHRQCVEVDKDEEPTRRSVRFSGRDEYTILEAVGALDKIPLNAANQAALAKFLQPKLKELGVLLGENQNRDNWHLELSPFNYEAENGENIDKNDQVLICEQHGVLGKQELDDEQISESMQRYEEMRRRLAIAEGRETARDNNSVCSDESKSSSDSQSSDSTMTETKIRKMENAEIAQVSGGILRSNSEVRRAIERNALRRSLTRFSDARKKDTNKNDRNDKEESSLLEKLKWLTASEDVTNGNTDDKEDDDDDGNQSSEDEHSSQQQDLDPRVQETIATYRRLAEMFNKTTSLRGDVQVPGDVREWKIKSDLFPGQKCQPNENDQDLPPGTSTFTAVPAVSICDHLGEDENDKLIYSGGVRYTREGILTMPSNDGDQSNEDGSQYSGESSQTTSMSDARKQFLSQTVVQSYSGDSNSMPRDRSSLASNPDSYTLDDIDEALHDDRSSSVPSSSQSSPRLSGRSDIDGTSTTESGYSSNETNGELGPILPVDMDELVEFVRQDASRMERLRRRYDESEDHGFCRRPSVRGIKPRFGSTTDLLKQMANQLIPSPVAQQSMTGSHMTWPYRDGSEEEGGNAPQPRRRQLPTRSSTLPALQEDAPYIPSTDMSMPIVVSSNMGSQSTNTTLIHSKAPRVVHMYASTGDLDTPYPRAPGPKDAPPPPRLNAPRESQPDLIEQNTIASMPIRTQSHTSLPQSTQFGSVQSLVMHPQGGHISGQDVHYSTCPVRRPASVHGHLPQDNIVTRPPLQPNTLPRPHSTISHYPPPHQFAPGHYHVHEEPARPTSENSHPPLAPRGSYPGTMPNHFSQPMNETRYQTTNTNFVPHSNLPPASYSNLMPTSHSHVQFSHHSHSHLICPPPPPQNQLGCPPPPHSHNLGQPISHVPKINQGYPQSAHIQNSSSDQPSPVGPGPSHGIMNNSRQPQQRILPNMIDRGYPPPPPQWAHGHQQMYHGMSSFPTPVSSHLAYTTPMVPEGPAPMMNGLVGKLEGGRDERGVPEGASSSPRGHETPYSPQTSPTRDHAMLLRHAQPINMIT